MAESSGILYVVATPIGNLEDMTFRALDVLKEVGLIAAEDTRRTRILLSRYGIRTPMISYREQNRERSAPRILSHLARGGSAALVTDAGTPGLSDPGHHLVRACAEDGVRIVPVPGPSALAAVISASGLPLDRFMFEGFLPSRPKARRNRLSEIGASGASFVFHESPARIVDSLRDIEAVLGDREVVVAREMTKVHEEFLRGRASAVAGDLEGRKILGEFAVVVEGSPSPGLNLNILEASRRLLREGLSPSRTAGVLSELTGVDRRSLYRIVTGLEEPTEKGGDDG